MNAVIVSFGPSNSVTRSYSTTAALLADRELEAFLGADFGNSDLMVNGRLASETVALKDGDRIEIITRANKKNAQNVTVSFGPGNSVVRDYSHTKDLLADTELESFLGADFANCDILRNGQTGYSGPLSNGDRIELVTRANKKNIR